VCQLKSPQTREKPVYSALFTKDVKLHRRSVSVPFWAYFFPPLPAEDFFPHAIVIPP
jgi:hypothetical protein